VKRIIATFFLSCALLLLFGHSVLPHNHQEQDHVACEISEVKALSWPEIIKIALAHDLGANHLEEYKNCPPSEFVSKNFYQVQIYLKQEIEEDYSLTCTTAEIISSSSDFCSQNNLKTPSLRAPPEKS